MLDRFRDLIVLASVPDAIDTGLLDVPPDRGEALKGQAKRYGLASLTRAADLVATGLDQMRGATSPRLLLELMCAQVLLPAAATDERSLLARLEALEAGAGPVAGRVPVTSRQENNDYPERSRVSPPPRQPPAPAPTEVPTPAETPAPAEARAPVEPAGTPQAAPSAAHGQQGGAQRPAPVPPSGAGAPAAPPRSAGPFTHAGGTPGSPAEAASAPPSAPRGAVSVDVLRQAWPNVVEAVKAKGRVPWMLVRNASVASYDEGVLTLRFPRQGDVKGFQGTKYEDVVKQALNAMFGINVVIRAVTGGGDAPSPGRRPGPGPAPAAPPAQQPYGQATQSSHGQSGQPEAAAASPDHPSAPPAAQAFSPGANGASSPAGQAVEAAGGSGRGSMNSFGGPMSGDGDLPPLPPLPPPDDDEDFDPDDEVMSSSTTVNDLTGMALIQRELGAQIIAEYDD
jgi:DNA polymerase-3 subunit gamma/tau